MDAKGLHGKLSAWLNDRRHFPRLSPIVFVFLFLILCLWYRYPHFAMLRPQGAHQWRQADCLSLTLNYQAEDRPFLQPATHFLGKDGTGQTMSEFPLLYYGVAQLWKVTGPSEPVYRMVELLFLLAGLLAMMKSMELLLKDSLFAILLTLLFFTSPIIAYYGLNFLSDIPALSLSLMGTYASLKFVSTRKHGFLFGGFLLFLLAGLMKASAGLMFFALAATATLTVLRKEKAERKPLNQKIFILMGATLLIWLMWYGYAMRYNQAHNSGQFLVGILPLWQLDGAGILDVVKKFSENIFVHLFRPGVWTMTGLCLLYLVFKRKQAPPVPLRMLVFLLCGLVLFLLLFFQVFDQHDYYLLNMMVCFPAIWVVSLMTLKQSDGKIHHSPLVPLLLLVFLIHNADFARRRMSSRHHGWMNDRHETLTKDFEMITPWLREHGISRNDKVIVAGDSTINVALYLADVKGWTDYADLGTREAVEEKIRMGAVYLLTVEGEADNRTWLNELFPESVGTWGKVKVSRIPTGS